MQTNNLFSFRRLTWLFRQSLIINKRIIGISLIGFSGTLFAALFIFQLMARFRWTDQNATVMFLVLFFILGVIYSSLSFPAFRSKEKSMSYLLHPASSSEKFVFEILTRIIAFIIIFPVLYWLIANAEGWLAHQFFPELTHYRFSVLREGNGLYFQSDDTVWQVKWLVVMGVLSIFFIPFTGAGFFRKSPLLKTMFTLVIIGAAYTLFIYILFKGLHLHDYEPQGHRVLFIRSKENVLTFSVVATGVINLALLAMVWFGIKEKEA